MQKLTNNNLEFEQTLFLLRSSLVKAKGLLAYSGENQASFDKTLGEIIEAEQANDSLKKKLFIELAMISNLIKELLKLDKNNAKKEIELLLKEVLKLGKEDSKKILGGILKIEGEK